MNMIFSSAYPTDFPSIHPNGQT